MPKTTWTLRNQFDRSSWLTRDGGSVLEPLLEESPSGRKVRLAGTEESVYEAKRDTLTRKGLHAEAAVRGTEIWMPINPNENFLRPALGFDPNTTSATFNLDPDYTTARQVKMTAWWKFKHPTLPIHAYAHAQLRRTSPTALTVITRLVAPITTPNDTRVSAVSSEAHPGFTAAAQKINSLARRAEFEGFVEEAKSWDVTALTTRTGLLERPAVELLHKQVRVMEALDRITIPDLRGAEDGEFDWLELELEDTNVTGRFLTDLADYLDSDTAVEEALSIYKQLILALRGAGMVLPANLNDNQFAQALNLGDDRALTISLGKEVNDDGDPTREHGISIHLPTGTFVVSCSVRTDKDKVSHAWDEAVVIAQLTGKEDELLTYARRYAERDLKDRAKKIIRKRKIALRNDEPKEGP